MKSSPAATKPASTFSGSETRAGRNPTICPIPMFSPGKLSPLDSLRSRRPRSRAQLGFPFSACYNVSPKSYRHERAAYCIFQKVPFVEELPRANAPGDTLEEARSNLQEAVQLVLEANRSLVV